MKDVTKINQKFSSLSFVIAFYFIILIHVRSSLFSSYISDVYLQTNPFIPRSTPFAQIIKATFSTFLSE